MTPELTQYFQFFTDYHKQFVEAVHDLPTTALNWRPVETESADAHITNSVAVLIAHVTGAQRFWVGEIAGERPQDRHREAEFKVAVTEAAQLIGQLDRAHEVIRSVLETIDPARLDTEVVVRQRTVTIRWAILHALEHTALHLGHFQMTVQLWHLTNDASDQTDYA